MSSRCSIHAVFNIPFPHTMPSAAVKAHQLWQDMTESDMVTGQKNTQTSKSFMKKPEERDLELMLRKEFCLEHFCWLKRKRIILTRQEKQGH